MSETSPEAKKIFVLPDGRMPPASTAPYTGFAEKTLAMWRSHGTGPPFCKLAGRVFYFKPVLDEWIAERSGLLCSMQAKTQEQVRRQQRLKKL